jgi:hypothetical protein
MIKELDRLTLEVKCSIAYGIFLEVATRGEQMKVLSCLFVIICYRGFCGKDVGEEPRHYFIE